jgi:apolipoprotein N-acyltransferase
MQSGTVGMAETSSGKSRSGRPGRVVALAASSGVLGALSFPRLSWHLLIWVAFVPLLLALRSNGVRRRFLLGLTTGIVGFLGAFYWVGETAARFLNIPFAFAALLFLIFIVWCALQFALFGALLPARRDIASSVFLPASVWVLSRATFPWSSRGAWGTPCSRR